MRRLKFYRYLIHSIFPNTQTHTQQSQKSSTTIINNNNNNHSHHHYPKSFNKNIRGKRKSIRKSFLFGIIVFSIYFFFIGLVSYLAFSSSTTKDSSGFDYGLGRRLIRTIQLGAGAGSNNHYKNETSVFLDSSSSYMQMSSLGLVHLRSQGNLLSDILRSQSLFKCVPGGVHFRKLKDNGTKNSKELSIGLVSFPGSGNTWLRYLIQSSTGIYTGSVYKDFALLRNGFPGESITDSRVIVVKTHEYGPRARDNYSKIILLLRKPREAILAEFNRISAGHVGVARKETFFINKGENWSYFVAQKGRDWRETYLDWINHFPGEIFLTLYSSLVQNTLGELESMLKFLEIPISSSTLRCVIKYKDGIYKRRHGQSDSAGLKSSKEKTTSSIPFNPFTPQMDRFLWAQEQIVISAIQNRTQKMTYSRNIRNINNNLSGQKQLKFL